MIVWWWWVWFHQSKIYNNFTQICCLLKSNRNPTAQIFLMFLQRLRTGNSTNSRPIQTNSFNIWTKTWESNTKRLTITTRVIKLWNNNFKILTKKPEFAKRLLWKRLKETEESLYRKWKEPQGKIPSMSLLIFSKLAARQKKYFLPNASPSHLHIFIFSCPCSSMPTLVSQSVIDSWLWIT